ncbi:MAG: YggS family pyridoxal phosphate-dependent enzyme [Mycobacteriaceae bacterium]
MIDRCLAINTAIQVVNNRLSAACESAGREQSSVTLLPVTKYFPAADIRILHEAGFCHFGESKDQEATQKILEIKDFGFNSLRWHMVGRIQSNKVKSIASWAYAVHSVDRVSLVDILNKATVQALESGQRTDPLGVFVQVSLDDDIHRGGVAPAEIHQIADRIEQSPELRLLGLMAVPPLGVAPEDAFGQLAKIQSRFVGEYPSARELSAGMSSDMETAVKYGSTCVRVGTALLGSRPITSV